MGSNPTLSPRFASNRAKRGDSGALYLQSATAGLNSTEVFFQFRVEERNGEGWVLRDESLLTRQARREQRYREALRAAECLTEFAASAAGKKLSNVGARLEAVY